MDIGIAKALNMQIRRLAEMLPGGLEHLYGFSCECGCGETLQLSAADFDQHAGAWLDGHSDGKDPSATCPAGRSTSLDCVPPTG